MKPELIVIDSEAEALKLVDYLADKDLVAYDTETTGVHRGALVVGFSLCAEEGKAYYVILKVWDTEAKELVEVTSLDTAKTIINCLIGKKLIMHNSVYDCFVTEGNFNIRLIESIHTDTMILAHLLNENRKVGLKDLAAECFGADVTKEQQEMKASVLENGGVWQEGKGGSKEMYKADPYILGKYGAQDALLTFKLFYEFVPELFDQGLDKFFYEDESMPLLRGPTYEMNTTGLKVDLQKLAELKQTLKAECAEDKAFILQEIHEYVKDKYPGTNKKTQFNIGASAQLAWLMFIRLELDFGVLTKGGKTVCKQLGLKLPYTSYAKRDFIRTCAANEGQVYAQAAIVNGKKKAPKKYRAPQHYIACDKHTLVKYKDQYKWVAKLLEYQKKQKLLSTYAEGIEKRVNYGTIHPSFLQHGTTSGRYSSKNPNFQNLPRDDKRVKSCIVARPGRVFVGADYSQLEPRVFAYYSRDARLMGAFAGSDDFYSVIGMETFDITDAVPLKEGPPNAFGVKYKSLRDDSKVVGLASAYGSTAFQLAKTTRKSVEATQEIIDKYFERFPGVRVMQQEAHQLVKKQGYVTNLYGRKRRLPEAMSIDRVYGNGDLPYEARNILNQAVNHRIQSTGASIVNRAAIKFFALKTQAGLDAKFVLQVHDSLIVECDPQDAENISVLLQFAMEETTLLEGVKLEAVPKTGGNLAEV